MLAAALMLALSLAGLGPGVASPTDGIGIEIAGTRAPICHSGEADRTGHPPGQQSRHDCCDACALLSPAILPEAPATPTTLAATRMADAEHPATWVPALARLRTPRQAQGPPAR